MTHSSLNKQTNKCKTFLVQVLKNCHNYCWVLSTHTYTHTNMHTYICCKLVHFYYSSLSKHCILYEGKFLGLSAIESDRDTHRDPATQVCFKSKVVKIWNRPSSLWARCVSILYGTACFHIKAADSRWTMIAQRLQRQQKINECAVLPF